MTSTKSCCSIETGSLILGIVSSILSCAAILYSLYELVTLHIESIQAKEKAKELLRKAGEPEELDAGISYADLLGFSILGTFVLLSIVNLVFSVFLSHGVLKLSMCRCYVWCIRHTKG